MFDRASLASARSLALLLHIAAVATTVPLASARPQGGGPVVEFSATDSSHSEADGVVALTLTLSAPPAAAVSLPFSAAGTATSGVDFMLPASPLVIPAGATSAQLNVSIVNDALLEGREQFTLTLGAPTGATLGGQSQHRMELLDDEPAANVRFSTAASVRSEDDNAFDVTVQLSAPLTELTTVQFSVGGTATLGADYTISSSPLAILGGQTSGVITITPIDDGSDEPNETIVLDLSAPTNATLGSVTQHVVTLTDDDLPPSVRFQLAASQLSEVGPPTNLIVELSEVSGFPVTVGVGTTGTATAGSDYTFTPGPLVIPAGTASVPLTVTPLNDSLVEGPELATFTLTAPQNATLGARASHDLTILDDETIPTVRFVNATASSPEGAGVVNVSVTLSQAAATQVSVPYTVGGSASQPADFTVPPGPLTIPVGQTSASIPITIVDDTLPEPTETVSLTMGAPTGATLGATTQHVRSILDNDTPVTVRFATASSVRAEGAGTVQLQVTLSSPPSTNVSVPFTFSGTAQPADYVAPPSPLVIPSGTTSRTLDLQLVQDSLHEATEQLIVTLGAPTGATLGAQVTHALDITDNDPAPAVGFTMHRTVVDEISGGFSVRVQLSAVSGLPVSVPFTISGPAAGPSDIVPPVSPAVIPAGQPFVDLPVGLIVDRIGEAGETVTFRLVQPMTGAVPGAITALLVAINDGIAGAIALPPALAAMPTAVTFPQIRVGDTGAARQIVVSNVHSSPMTFLGLAPEVGHIGAYQVSYPGAAPPVVLAPAQSVLVDVRFAPLTPGPREATFVVRQNYGGLPPTRVQLSGVALGPVGADIVMNAGGHSYVDAQRQLWTEDYGATQSEGVIVSVVNVAGTTDDPLFQSSRWGQTVRYALPLPNGAYDVRFQTWEPVLSGAGQRVFDGYVEGQLVYDDIDPYALVGTNAAWVSPVHRAVVADGVLDLRFDASVGRAVVSALEVRAVPLVTSPTALLNFGTVDQGTFAQLNVELRNTGLAPGRLTNVQITPGVSGPASEFSVEVGGLQYAGGPNSASYALDVALPPGQSVFVPVIFTPTIHRDNDLELRFTVVGGDPIQVDVRGTGGANSGWGFLHPVIDQNPLVVIDYDGSGAETIDLLGMESHTHEPGHSLSAYEWRRNGSVIGATADIHATLPVGISTVALTISDNNAPPAQATDSKQITVYAPNAVPGVLARYYDGAVAGEMFLLDNVPATANFVARQAGLLTSQVNGKVGASSFTTHVMVRWNANFMLNSAATVTFTAAGGDGRRLFVNGTAVTGPRALSAGIHTLEARFAASDVNDLPLTLAVSVGGAAIPGFEGTLTHGEGQLLPVIHTMPTQGTDLGGNDIVIQGFGFFPQSQVVVNWGASTITSGQFVSFTPERIQLISPPGSGPIQVTVTTPNGTSNPLTFTYSPSGPVPVNWNLLWNNQISLNDPTRAAWGPDGRLWVALIDGSLRAVTYDDNWNATNVQYYAGVSALSNKDVLGIAFSPYDTYDPNVPSSVRVYVSHGDLFQNGGLSFTGPSYFTGQVSRLSGPNFDSPTPLVSGLPVSNHDHSVNGLAFDGNGDLLIACGGNTNAGVTWPLMGDVPESPLSGAILKAFVSRAGFNGAVAYLDRQTLTPVDDQRYGQSLLVAPNVDVEVFAPGFRNPFDLLIHSNGYLYATDNGPNDPYGPASTGMATEGGNPHPWHPDELLLVERGNYYGHPNRARGNEEPRQTVYRDHLQASIPHQFTQEIASLDSSTNGIDEYRATAFNSQLRGQLVLMKWGGPIRFVRLSTDGRSVVSTSAVSAPWNGGLDVITGPGGALVSVDYSQDQVRVQIPVDVAALGLTPYDVFPGRGPNTGGTRFVLGGVGFGTLANTTVRFAGVPAILTSVSAKRIRGIVPALPSTLVGKVDVSVTVASNTVTIQQGFQALPATPGLLPGVWRSNPAMPASLGEVACAEVAGMVYVFGEADARTFRYDVLNGTWSTTLASRPYPGSHHGCEVWNGKVYLFGGFAGGAEGRVQIYDPATNTWSLGTPMPWAGGSCATASIHGKIYVGGGIVGSVTVANLAAYDPALNSWTSLGALPVGVNHAAASTDGERFFIFGGRQGPNVPAPGFTTVQVYDPVAATWQTSNAGQRAPLPLGRGGTGKAVFYRGEFYVIGGEDNLVTFAEVQAYNPVTNTWRRDTDMPTARHGIFPVLFQDRLFVIGGGRTAGPGASALVEVFQRP